MPVDADMVLADLRELRQRSGGPDGARRLAWSPDWMAARRWLQAKLADLPVSVEQDAAGNLWADLDPTDADHGGRSVVIGSHIDAVPGGGWLDGALGVMAALGVLRVLVARRGSLPVRVSLVDWADEEGARFGRSLLGSSASAGTLVADDVRDLRDADGVRLADALAACGVDLNAAAVASDRLQDACAYVELHIEQGPVLLDSDRLVSAVSGTFGDQRFLVRFEGQTSHAGTPPMDRRRDSLSAAAAAALAIRNIGLRHGGVATVGAIRSTPGVVTAVAGASELMLDIRHLDEAALGAMTRDCLTACAESAARFGCTATPRQILDVAPTPFDPRLIDIARAAIARVGGEAGEAIPSGALHDATEIGRRVPTVMLFAMSDPPLSHTADEDSPEEALRVAIAAYAETIDRLLDELSG